MLDIKFIRENPDVVKENCKKKFQEDKVALVDELLQKDEEWRKLKYDTQELKSKKNSLNATIAKTKKEGGDVAVLMEEAKTLPQTIKENDEKLEALQKRNEEILYLLPNIIADSVPLGKDDKENVETGKFGEVPSFSFPAKNHVELSEGLGIAEFESASRIAGSGFFFLKGDLVKLNQALIRFAQEFMEKKGYTLVEPPLMLTEEAIHGVMPFADFEEHAYKIEGKDQYLIATSEHPLMAWFRNQVIDKKNLPIKLCGFSQCFRQEIGSHGIEEKGLFRTHQFNKVEQVVICEPEDSSKYYDEMRENSIEIYKALELPVRTLECCSGDLADLKFKSEDLEAWSPVKNEYYEVGSLSNLTDAQARRSNIKIFDGEKRYTPHSLNNTALATSRCMVAVIENNQQADGSIKVPKVLVPFVGKETISPQ